MYVAMRAFALGRWGFVGLGIGLTLFLLALIPNLIDWIFERLKNKREKMLGTDSEESEDETKVP